MNRILLTLILVVTYLGVTPQLASADCVGPTIEHDTGKFEAGDQLDIEGFAFGTNCYDTGPPPEGEGVLGVPVSGIEILLVQGDLIVPVGAGDADGNYEFMVSITVPSDLAPGEFSVVASFGGGGEAWNQTEGSVSLISSDVMSPAVIADFEPPNTPLPQPNVPAIGVEETQEDSSDRTLLLAVGAGVLLALAGSGVVAWRLNKQPD